MKKKLPKLQFFFFVLTILFLFGTCAVEFVPLAKATIGDSCCYEKRGIRVQKYNEETDRCDHYVAGVKVEEYDILCDRDTEKCQSGLPEERGTCISKDPLFIPTPTPKLYFPEEEGYCSIYSSPIDKPGWYSFTVLNEELKTGDNYQVEIDGEALEKMGEGTFLTPKTDGVLTFTMIFDPLIDGGVVTIRRANLGRKLICTGTINVAYDDVIDVTCNGGQGINSAIGCIPTTNLNTFASWVLEKIVFIASGIAFLLLVFGAFQIITSSGDPKKTQAAKELITAAVSGLLFIILSVLLLKLIGVDILQIPEFGN